MASAPLSLARRMLFGRKASSIAQAGSGLDGVLPPRKRPFRLLAIDGGGIRGILPAMVLADLERRTNRPIIDLFDMIVGTSTGGLIALALACPGEGGRPRHTARDLIQFYQVEGKRVFSRSVWHKIRAVGNAGGREISEFGDRGGPRWLLRRMPAQGCFVRRGRARRYQIERRFPFFFKVSNARIKRYYDYPMKQVIRAATAAPTYFEPARIGIDGPNDYYALVDGALFAYNPGMCAYTEVLHRFPDHESILMVSLGTGELTRRLPYDEVKDWGAARWAQPTFALMCDGICDVVDYQLQQLLPPTPDGIRQYYRFQARLDVGNDDMDDASNTNIRVLKLLAEDMLQANRATLRHVSEQLLHWAPARPDALPPNVGVDPTPSGDSLREAAQAAAEAADRD